MYLIGLEEINVTTTYKQFNFTYKTYENIHECLCVRARACVLLVNVSKTSR